METEIKIHRQSCTRREFTGEMEVRATHTELKENWHDRAEGEKHHVDGMQVNSKEQDEVERTSGRPVFHLETKGTKRGTTLLAFVYVFVRHLSHLVVSFISKPMIFLIVNYIYCRIQH